MQNTYMDYAQGTCDAIEILVNSALSKAKFDRTIQASIVECIDEEKNIYKIRQQDATYNATAANPGIIYKPGTTVYILIPENDYSKEKKIIASIGDIGVNKLAKEIAELNERLTKIEQELF